jgi:hypothetical protein
MTDSNDSEIITRFTQVERLLVKNKRLSAAAGEADRSANP